MNAFSRQLSLAFTFHIAAALLIAATGCKNTGKDIENAGEKIFETIKARGTM
jgi:predicted small secreted protein